MFLRYTGPDKAGESFVTGKVYLSERGSEKETVDISLIRVRDEDGRVVVIDPEEERFVFLSENYAAVVNAFDEFEVGSIVVVSGVSDDGRMYDVVGYGYRDAGDLVLMDMTNVTPRAVLRASDGVWKTVVAVNESLAVSLEGDMEMTELDDVRVAVSDGDVMMIPMLTCIESLGEEYLTEGNHYVLLEDSRDSEYGTCILSLTTMGRRELFSLPDSFSGNFLSCLQSLL